MAVTISKNAGDIQQLPLVELAYEIMKSTKETFYFRDLMTEIQELRGLSQEQVTDVIARLYTEINVDGRFICIGQNVWGLKRWYPVDKVAEKTSGNKRFVRATGDAFSDDDEELDDYDDSDLEAVEELTDPLDALARADDDDGEDSDDEFAGNATEEEDVDYNEEEDSEEELEEVPEEELDEDDEED